jgi:hypothetical protein
MLFCQEGSEFSECMFRRTGGLLLVKHLERSELLEAWCRSASEWYTSECAGNDAVRLRSCCELSEEISSRAAHSTGLNLKRSCCITDSVF